MPKIKRIVVPGEPHHITQRGNYRQRVFFRERDYEDYLGLVGKFAEAEGVRILAYCLMPNHVHLIAVPEEVDSLHRAFERIQGDYARNIHVRLHRKGHFWEGRYRSVPMDNEHFWAAMVYIERNPLSAGLVKRAEEWRWSSAQFRLCGIEQPYLNLSYWREKYTARQWRKRLEIGLTDAAMLERIELATLRGIPLGNRDYLSRLEREFGININGRGRPRKVTPEMAAPWVWSGVA